jgi:hypothetical protein
MKVTFFNDAGHGWYSVKKAWLEFHGLMNKVSSFSYQKGDTIYLEEDCDASLLFNKAKEIGLELSVKSSYKHRSPVRSYSTVTKKLDSNEL